MDRSDLYALPPDEFTAQRNALAKALRRDGARDEAAEVAKLRKPSVAAWAVNQLVRQPGADLAALLEAGDALQRVQAELLDGKAQPDTLRPALDAERAAVGALIERARSLLRGDGTAGRLQQVADTLHAAALDEDARERVMGGCLERELQHVGLGGIDAAPPRPSAADRKREREAADRARAERRAEASARRDAEQAERHLEVVRQRREQVAEQLGELDGELKAAKRAAADAEKALKKLAR